MNIETKIIDEGHVFLNEVKSRLQHGTICHAAICGSHAFDLARESSDIDLKGIYLAQSSDLLGLNCVSRMDNTTSHHDKDIDYEMHEIWKYLKLLLKCNPTILEIAFVDEALVLHSDTNVFKNIKEWATKALHSGYCPKRDKAWGIWGSFYGYARNQLNKGCSKIIKEIEKEFGLAFDGKTLNVLRDLVETNSIYQEFVDTQVDKKFFSHNIRLLSSACYCLETGEFTVIPPSRDFCRGILSGDAGILEIIDYFNTLSRQHDGLREENALPDEPDREYFNNWLVDLRLKQIEGTV